MGSPSLHLRRKIRTSTRRKISTSAPSSSTQRRRIIFVATSSKDLHHIFKSTSTSPGKPRYRRDGYAQLFLSSTHVIPARNTFRSSGVSYTTVVNIRTTAPGATRRHPSIFFSDGSSSSSRAVYQTLAPCFHFNSSSSAVIDDCRSSRRCELNNYCYILNSNCANCVA